MVQPPALVDPDQPLTDGFTIRLPFAMARRIEEGSLVFWHSPMRLTFWIDVFEVADADPPPGWRARRSAEATGEIVERGDALIRYGYRLAETVDDDRAPAFYGFVSDGRTEILLAGYFDHPAMIDAVLATWRSIHVPGAAGR